MKKLAFVFAAMVAVSFASCGNTTEQGDCCDSDSVAVEEVCCGGDSACCADSACCDSAACCAAE